MSSAISTDSAAFRPWHFFVLTALAAATAGVLLSRGTTPAAMMLISAGILAAGLAGLALYRTLSPFVRDSTFESGEVIGGRTRAALEREKTLVLRAIKELEFDNAMGKMSQADFEDMAGRLRIRAMGLIKQLDEGAEGYRELIERELQARLASRRTGAPRASAGSSMPAARSAATADAPTVNAESKRACAACGTLNDADARFCKTCGGLVG